MHSIRPLIPLLVTAGIMLGGNGLQATLIALRGSAEGFTTGDIGFIGTTYFAGFLLGCFAVTPMLKSVGHVRSFAALAALASACTLMLVLIIDPWVWALLRFLSGFCFAGIFTIMESWLNSGVRNADRARVLSVYRIIDIGSVTGAQYLIPVFGVGGFTIFAIMSMMISLSLAPVSLADRSNPRPPEDVKLDLRAVWTISPLAAIGCVAVGLTNSAFRSLSPVYAEQIGMSVTDVVTFLAVSIIGSVIVQYPLGHLSDKWDRRYVLLLTSTGALVSALAIAWLAGAAPFANFVWVFIFGSFAMPMYSLAAAHANDRADPSQFVMVNAALMLFYSVGAIVGPLAAALMMEHIGPAALFLYCAAVYGAFILVILHRIATRDSVPESERGRFVALLRTSPLFSKLTARTEKGARRPE